MKKILIVGALLAACSAASAQSPIIQSGSVTPGHAWKVITNGVAGDAGTAANGSLTSLGVTASGPALCQNSGPVTGPYNQLCFSPTGTGGGFSWFNYGGATGTPTFNINGTLYPFFGSGTGNVLGPSTTTPGCAAPWANTTGTLLGNNCAISLSGAVATLNGSFTSTTAAALSNTFSSTTVLDNLYFNLIAAAASSPEVAAVFRMTSATGSGNYNGYWKQALGAEAICTTGSASCWGFTSVLTDNGMNAAAYKVSTEIDFNENNADCANIDPTSLSCGNLVLTGAGSHNANFGLLIAGGGKILNGIIFEGSGVGPIAADINSYSGATDFLLDQGSHTYGLNLSGGTYSTDQILGVNWSVDPSGDINSQNLSPCSTCGVVFNGRARLFSPADGIVEFLDNASASFTRLDFGGLTSSYPAIQVSGTGLLIALADGSALAPLSSSTMTIGAGSAITSSGAGGALGSNAFTSTAYAPLASPSFTGTVAMSAQLNVGTLLTSGGSAQTIDSGAVASFHGATDFNMEVREASSVFRLDFINDAADANVPLVIGASSLSLPSATTLTGTVFMTGLTAGSGSAALCLNATGSQVESDTSATICGISALRYKNLVAEITPDQGVAGILSLRGESYTYKPGTPGHANDNAVHVSLIADDMAAMNHACAEYSNAGVENYMDRCFEAYQVAFDKKVWALLNGHTDTR